MSSYGVRSAPHKQRRQWHTLACAAVEYPVPFAHDWESIAWMAVDRISQSHGFKMYGESSSRCKYIVLHEWKRIKQIYRWNYLWCRDTYQVACITAVRVRANIVSHLPIVEKKQTYFSCPPQIFPTFQFAIRPQHCLARGRHRPFGCCCRGITDAVSVG